MIITNTEVIIAGYAYVQLTMNQRYYSYACTCVIGLDCVYWLLHAPRVNNEEESV